jgi:hypothetical protein
MAAMPGCLPLECGGGADQGRLVATRSWMTIG